MAKPINFRGFAPVKSHSQINQGQDSR
jgi:hypothetical protein